uniref:Mos1 transposase HTH domain-containing protein n=1 Tax=Graphocephala atropunctata TaxID=36148 RepID=A0A1B6MNJ7_9HEMI
MHIQNVRKWCREFAEGHTNVHDEAGCGRPSVLEKPVTKVLFADRYVIVREIAKLIGDVSKTNLDKILTDIFNYNKACVWWVPQMLTDEHKKKLMESGPTHTSPAPRRISLPNSVGKPLNNHTALTWLPVTTSFQNLYCVLQ